MNICIVYYFPTGIRLVVCSVSDFDLGIALTYENNVNLIYSNSWGFGNDGDTIYSPGNILQMVLQNAVQMVHSNCSRRAIKLCFNLLSFYTGKKWERFSVCVFIW